MQTNKKLETNLEIILNSWKFPKNIIDKYKSIGIKEIFEWQAECLNVPNIQTGGNLVYSAPTSAGKTLVAELLMLKNIIQNNRKAIMIYPFVSLAREKLNHLQAILSDSHIRADGFIGSSSPSGGFNAVDIAFCTIEKANSLINRLIDDESIFDLGIIVIDELHMVNDEYRGYIIELILSKVKYLCYKFKDKSKIQLVGMSATLPNLKVLSDWLNASLFESNYRPIELNEYYKFDKSIYDRNSTNVRTIKVDERIEKEDKDLVTHLVLETIMEKLGVLVFCGNKQRCENIALSIAKSIRNLEKISGKSSEFLNKEKLYKCFCELKNTPAGLDPILHDTVRYGIGFHHAGLTIEEREILENNFKTNTLLCLVCTTTLSSGINFPARRVIIRTPVAYQNKSIDSQTYKQMAGRAGRKGIDTIGESIIMCANQNEKKFAEMLINSTQAEIKFNTKNTDLKASIKRALLETIVSGIATKREEIIEYTNCFITNEKDDLNSSDQYLKWLETNKFIAIIKSKQDVTSLECYKATQLGHAVVASAMSPDDGLIIFSELSNALKCFVLDTELHCIYQITPINICEQWTSSSSKIDWNRYYTIYSNLSTDMKRVADLVGVRERFIVKMINGYSINTSDTKLIKVHTRFYTALILNDLVNETPFSTVLDKFDCHKGFLQSLQQQSSTYAQMIHIFCNRLGWFNLEILIEQFQTRLLFGVQRQLLDLVRIKLLNSHRARLFYNAGLTTVASIATCDMKKVEKILRSGMQFVSAESSKLNEQLNNKGEIVFWSDGKCYTYWEASEVVNQEANDLLKQDLESLGIKVDFKKDKANNKTIFEFNETYDSMIQSQKNRSSLTPVDSSKKENGIHLVTEKTEKLCIESLQNEPLTISSKVEVQIPKECIQEVKLISNEPLSNKNSEIMIAETPMKEDEQSLKNIEEINAINHIKDFIFATQENPPRNENNLITVHQNHKTKTTPQEILDSLNGIQNSIYDTQEDDDKIIIDSLNCNIQEDQITKNKEILNSLKDLIFETQEETPQNVIKPQDPDNKTSNETLDDEDLLNQISLTSLCNKPKVNSKIQNEIDSLKDLIFDTQINEPLKENLDSKPNDLDKLNCSSFMDDQFMLEAAESYDKKSRKSLIEIKNLNTTCVSADILEMCDIFEKKSVLSSKKKPKINLNITKNLDRSKCKNLFSEQTANESEFHLNDLDKQINLLDLKLNLIQNEIEYEQFYNSIKSKSVLAISLAVQKYEINPSETNADFFYVHLNHENQIAFKFYGVFISLESDKQKQINLLIAKKDKNFIKFIKNIFEREDLTKILFFTKEHYKLLNELFEIRIKSPCYDPIIADWILNQQLTTIFQIKQKYCPSYNTPIDADLRKSKQCYGCNMSLKSIKNYLHIIRRASIECQIAIYCFDKLKMQLQLQNLWIYYAKIESEIVLIAAQIERDGFGFSQSEFLKQKNLLMKNKKEIEIKIYKIANRDINLNSTAEVAYLLYDHLKLKPSESSRNNLDKFKHHSTSKDTLLQLSKQHVLPQMIILWRKINHTLSNSMYPVDQAKVFNNISNMYRIHSTIDLFHVTGRMNFNDPCLQHIPKDFDIDLDVKEPTEISDEPLKQDGYEEGAVFFLEKITDDCKKQMKKFISIRSLFIPNTDRVLLSADYCQLELRIITNLCKDESLIESFSDLKNDIFNTLASKWLNLPVSEIDDEKRQNVKKIIYGIIYGISPKTLACFLNQTESETTHFIETFYQTFPGLKKFINAQIDNCRTKGYVESIRKRRRNFPNITNSDKKLKAQAERQAVNTVIQGSASDLVKSAMVKIEKTIRKKFPNELSRGAFLVLQLHDELIYEVKKSDLNEVKSIVKDCMENCIDFPARMKIKMRIGDCWGSLDKTE